MIPVSVNESDKCVLFSSPSWMLISSYYLSHYSLSEEEKKEKEKKKKSEC